MRCHIDYYFFILLLLISVLVNCGKMNDPIVDSDVPQVIVIEDLGEFEMDSIHIDTFTINKMSVNEREDIISFEVSYSGGCEDHQFQLYSTEGILYSNPPGCLVYLSHNGNNDHCKVLITETLSFSMSPFHNGTYDALILHIHGYSGEKAGTLEYKIFPKLNKQGHR